MNSQNQIIYNIQEAALDVLKEFQRICKKHDLRYFAIGGTCIGAVRHGGFIPWDDDIDVAMPYDDYLKFLNLSNNEFGNEYSIIGPHNCRHYAYSFIKLQNHNTTFIEQNDARYKDRYSGIYIDIFPIYALPHENWKVWIVERITFLQNKINLRVRFEKDFDDSIKWKLTWKACSLLRNNNEFNYYLEKQAKMLSKFSFEKADKVFFCWRMIPTKRSKFTYKNIFYKEDFKEMIEVPFENISIMIPNGYHRYLTMDFGEYMKLPPIEEQITLHPKAIVDLERPCKFYMDKGVI